MAKILVVDDEKGMRDVLQFILEKEGYNISVADSGEKAVEILKKEIFDLVITDIRMQGIDGIKVLKTTKELSPETIVLMITAFASVESAREALTAGAYDYITKPFKVDEIRLVIKNALEKRQLRKENILLKQELRRRFGIENIIGRSPAMQNLFSLIQKVATTTSSVLITGESGTGKELVARGIHSLSQRKDMPFVAINCGAMPDTLLESELFGYMKGSFTGAISNKKGLFEIADGGTIFLDEIGETPQFIQVKLLRFLEDHTFRRIGGTEDISVDVRIITATNRDLKDDILNGRFREDLYYRLNVIPIHIPPLRERREDIPLLIEYFLKKYSPHIDRRLTPEAMDIMLKADWKGNVRELENTIERVVALTDDEVIQPIHLPEELRQRRLSDQLLRTDMPEEGICLDSIVRDIEKDLLLKALRAADGVKTKAARLLNISFRSLRHRLKKYGIE